MGKPVFLVENLFNDLMFPHVVTASEEAPGHEAWRVATARRSRRNYWEPITANAVATLSVNCVDPVNADMLVLDRGHNLSGVSVSLQHSSDGSAWTTAWTAVVPASVSVNGALGTTPGALTEEGAWMYRFTPLLHRHYRLSIPAMGAGLKPRVTGLYLGESWQPDYLLDLPFSYGQRDLRYEQQESEVGWRGMGYPATSRSGEFGLKLSTEAEYLEARRHIEQRFLARNPMWIVFDDERAEYSLLAIAPPTTAGFSQAQGWAKMQGRIPYMEHEPVI